MYFFRDSTGNEVDLILDNEDDQVAIEIKSSGKMNSAMFKGLNYCQKKELKSNNILLYGGSHNEIIDDRLSVLLWTEIENL